MKFSRDTSVQVGGKGDILYKVLPFIMKMESVVKFSTLNFYVYKKVIVFQHSIMEAKIKCTLSSHNH